MHIHGNTIDDQARCVHYGGATDVIAIKFVCCGRYYPCYQCHAETEAHPAEQWPENRWSEKAVLCGVCGHQLTVTEYRAAGSCPACGAGFNPGCALHAHLYFQVPGSA
ncbi:MAG: hypothetical protein JWM23_91 [Microbacteriaceae bacterium]|jgi:uncharacterized CHY-type Zn-finger protein|nr:hypothetical protein [Microbacteriaceae bacterium]